VRIVDSAVTNQAGGTLIDASYPAADVTLDDVAAIGGNGRFLTAAGFRSVDVRNCSIERTRGIELEAPLRGASVVITRNRHHNVQGGDSDPVGNFVQFRVVRNARVDVSWNEVLNEYDASEAGDLVSIYYSSYTRVHDNYFQHQSKRGNAYDTSSQNGITIEGDSRASHNEIWNNQVVDGMGIGIFGGNDNFVHDNRVVQDGFLPDGRTRIGNGYEAMWIAPGGRNNRMRRNVVGFVNRNGKRMDGRLQGAPQGSTAEWRRNRHLPGPVTESSERREWSIWRTKLAIGHIRIGASEIVAPVG
jgi:hypothetical protein